jgi:hypothetical protein
VLYKPVRLTLACSDDQARIHYTLDGSVPTPDSPMYRTPILVRTACRVRARSFSDSGVDLVGAQAHFDAPPQPISIDFESVSPGTQAPLFVTQEENQTYTARVSKEIAASGENALKFVDGAGQAQPFNPHVFLRTAFTRGHVRTSFDIRISSESEFYCQWREYPKGKPFLTGPTLRVETGGRVTHDNQPLTTLPVDQWVNVEMETELGDQASGHFTLTLRIPGKETPVIFANLPCAPDFTALQWLGFVSFAEGPAVTFIDNVEIIPVAYD